MYQSRKITTNNQAAISSQFPRTRAFSTIRSRALGAPSKQLTKSIVYKSLLTHSMLSSCKDVNIPEIVHTVEREQGAGPSHTTRRWMHDMREPRSMIDPSLPVEHDRIQIGMFRPIRVDHTNCLQVTIKTHSFIQFLKDILPSIWDLESWFNRQSLHQ